MEPFEWLVLGTGLLIGGLFGANSKDLMRKAARGYLAMEDRTREWSANLREDFRDALEEARYERAQAELEGGNADETFLEEGFEQAPAAPRARVSRNSAGSTPRGASTKAGSRSRTASRKRPVATSIEPVADGGDAASA